MLLQQRPPQQPANDTADEAGSQKYGSHPEGHQLTDSVNVSLPVIGTLGKITLVIREEWQIVTKDPHAEQAVDPNIDEVAAFQFVVGFIFSVLLFCYIVQPALAV